MGRYLTTWLLLLLGLNMKAQPYCDVRTLTIHDGLASTRMAGIVQTKDGLMWFATWNGLCCYDGYRFRNFRNVPGINEVLSNNRLLVLESSVGGNLWCTTYDRYLYLFDTYRGEYVDVHAIVERKFEKDFRASHVWPLSTGAVWAADSETSDIFRIDESRFCEGHDDAISQIDSQGQAFRAVADSAGHEWLLTDKGLMMFSEGKTTWSVKDVPFCYAQQLGTSVFFSTTDGRMAVQQTGDMRPIMLTPTESVGRVNNLCALGNDTLLAATDRGVLIYDVKSKAWTLRSVQTLGQSQAEVKSLFTDSHHRIWAFNSERGVTLLDKDGSASWLMAEVDNPLEQTVSDMPFVYEDRNGTVWVTPVGGTFSYYDEGRLIPYVLRSTGRRNYYYPRIVRTCFDNSGNLWFTGTHDISVLNFRYRHFHFTPVVANTDVRSLMIDHQHRLWAGTASGYLAVFDEGSNVPNFLSPQGRLQREQVKFDINIYTMTEDSQGRIWIGTKVHGLYLLKPDGNLTHFVHNDEDPYSLSHNDIYSVDIDDQGHILVGSYRGGLNIVDESTGQIRFINCQNELSQYPMHDGYEKIRRVTHTKSGTILLSTNYGLVTLSSNFKRPQNIKFYLNCHSKDDPSGLLAHDVMQTLVTKNDVIYVVTLGGGVQEAISENLLQDSIRFMSVSVVDENQVNAQSLVEENNGNLWIIRESGIDRYDVQSEVLHQYFSDDIGPDIDLTETLPVHDALTDDIYLAANGGFVKFNQRELVKHLNVPDIVFTSVLFHHSNTLQPILSKQRIEVPSDDMRALTVYFSTLDYLSKSHIRYAYMLEDMDGGAWTYIDSGTNGASFNYLPAGIHRLLVRSTNSEGVWLDNVKVLEIYVAPKFTETWVAKSLFATLAAALIGLLVFALDWLRRRRKAMKNF